VTNGDEIASVILRTLSEISKKEKEKAVQKEDYPTAIAASVFEGLFRELNK
jgi:hypothetical protein